MSEHLDAAQAWAREAHGRLAEATAAHAAELERIREETQARTAIAEEDRDSAIELAEADKAEGIAAAEQRASRAEAQAQEAIAQARAEAEALMRVVLLRLKGARLQEICDVMNAEGVPTPGGGGHWWPSHVHRLLETLDAQALTDDYAQRGFSRRLVLRPP